MRAEIVKPIKSYQDATNMLKFFAKNLDNLLEKDFMHFIVWMENLNIWFNHHFDNDKSEPEHIIQITFSIMNLTRIEACYDLSTYARCLNDLYKNELGDWQFY